MKKLQLVKAGSAMLVASLAFAQSPAPFPPPPPWAAAQSSGTVPAPPTPAQMVAYKVNQLTTLLSLTSEQQTQATSIFTTGQSAAVGVMKRILATRRALQTAVENNDMPGITSQASQIGSLTGQEVEAHAKADAAFYAILTPEQQARYKQLKSVGPGFDGPGAGAPRGGPLE